MKKLVYILGLVLGISSCSDFLDVEPKGEVILETIEDYDMLLTPIATFTSVEELLFSADDFGVKDEIGVFGKRINDPDSHRVQLYSFTNRFYNSNISCVLWNDLYSKIYTYNKVISEVDNAKLIGNYKTKDKQIIKAEGQYGRAFMYFLLVNYFGEHYNTEASTNLSIPLVLDANISQELPKRATVDEVYKQILTDLEEAVLYLPKKEKMQNRPSKGAGYALLSRVYLYQSKYDKALKYAQLALQEQGALGDYTTVNVEYEKDKKGKLTDIFTDKTEKAFAPIYLEEHYIRFEFDYSLSGWSITLTDDLKGKFTSDDMRKILYFNKEDKITNIINPIFLPSIGEMYLTIAECEARLGNTSEALSKLNELRKKRIKNVVDKTMVDFVSSEDLLKFILDERRKELVMTGTRLFEVKRLNLEPKFQKTIIHKIGGKEYRAEPNSGTLVFPIPANVKRFNKNL